MLAMCCSLHCLLFPLPFTSDIHQRSNYKNTNVVRSLEKKWLLASRSALNSQLVYAAFKKFIGHYHHSAFWTSVHWFQSTVEHRLNYILSYINSRMFSKRIGRDLILPPTTIKQSNKSQQNRTSILIQIFCCCFTTKVIK